MVKRLVESVELINLFGSIKIAKDKVKMADFNGFLTCLSLPYLNTLYYVIVPLRCFLVEIHDGLYGFRLGFGFVFPFWILTPIFITNLKDKFYIYLCVLLCALEVIFWILFSKMSGSEFYKRPLSVAIFVSSLIFVLTFPWYLSWLREIDINKWVLPFFFKEDRFISKLISWVAIGLGSCFMFLFYLFF
ncbi:hypothetical protein LV49_03552 [Acinetobacter baumannii]|nr:hypothetical protein LV49_03552 [Acinetobacter baumannii]